MVFLWFFHGFRRLAGLFGVGGGIVKGPLMLEMGITPWLGFFHRKTIETRDFSMEKPWKNHGKTMENFGKLWKTLGKSWKTMEQLWKKPWEFGKWNGISFGFIEKGRNWGSCDVDSVSLMGRWRGKPLNFARNFAGRDGISLIGMNQQIMKWA